MPPVRYHAGSFPPNGIDWERLVPRLSPTAAAIARYDGMLKAVPNPAVLLAPLTTQEAVLSSKIEGTQATMGDVLEFEAGEEPESPDREADIREVLQYRAALRKAEGLLQSLPLSGRVLKAAHEVLLDGVRGQTKLPGEYRRGPNWIGPHECPVEQAKFVPVAVEHLADAMAAWERYANDSAPDRLVQVSILHAEFEAIHPFADGNGRLGRMLVPLFMAQVGLIRQPMFYVSGYLEAHRDAYYERLLAVSRDHDWTGWCEFFLDAIRSQAEANLAKVEAIVDLNTKMKQQLPELTRSQYAIRALDWIFERPVFRSSDFVEQAGIPEPTARRFLRVLQTAEVLKTAAPGSGRRAAVLAFPELLEIVEGRPVI